MSMIAVPKLLRCYDCDSFIDRHRTQVIFIIMITIRCELSEGKGGQVWGHVLFQLRPPHHQNKM